MSQTFETEFGGRTLTIETGKLARLAGGSVTVRYGDTMVLGTANRAEPRPGLDFFPLTVDFEERMYAAGKIPGGFIKRRGTPAAYIRSSKSTVSGTKSRPGPGLGPVGGPEHQGVAVADGDGAAGEPASLPVSMVSVRPPICVSNV